jgi:hypothetical protein
MYGTGSASIAWGLEADRLQTSLFLTGDGYGSSSREERSITATAFPFVIREALEGKQTVAFEQWSFAGELRTYPWRSAASLLMRGSLEASYAQRWTSNYARREIADSSDTSASTESLGLEDWRYDYRATYGGSIGLGRVRDATAVYHAYLLERRLLDTGALDRPLSQATRERIAALYYIQPRYYSIHDRAGKFFWRDLERILFEEGAVGLDAYSIFRATESYSPFRSRMMRRVGFFAGLTAEGRHIRRIVRRDQDRRLQFFRNDSLTGSGYTAVGERVGASDDEVLVGGEAEIHYPLGVRTQIDMTSRLLFPTRDLRHGMDLVSTFNAAYWIADRWGISASVQHSRRIARPYSELALPFGNLRSTGWSVQYGVEFDFYLEDRVSLNLSARESQGIEDAVFGFRPRGYRREGGVNVGISYRFLGGLNAPGLIPPQRLLPPGDPLY